MERVGVRQLRQNLSVYLRRVRAGETLEVTERNEPVALLSPLPAERSLLAELARNGWLARPASGRLRRSPAQIRTRDGRTLAETLEDVREDAV